MEATGVQAARKRAAVETYAQHEATLRRTARRYSLCADDADEALQRGLEILLRKAPTGDPRQLIKWMQKVVKHEALAVRSERERVLADPAALAPGPDAEDWIALLPSGADGPQERLERREAIGRSREALQALKPQELRALTLLAAGYSYAEIGEINHWSPTKVNRCVAEGREQFRRLLTSSEDGSRCEAMRPLLSAFCDGEASPQEAAELREHLRACAGCRATLRAYRAAPAAAAALAPVLPLHHSLWERLQDAVGSISSRLGERGEAVAQLAEGSGAGGAGLTGLAKIAALCLATAGATGACVASGLVPAPLGAEMPHRLESRQERRLVDRSQPQPAPTPAPKSEPAPEPEADPAPAPEPEVPAESEPVATEPAPVSAEPVEAAPPPAPEPAPAPAPATSGGGNPAGEFGP
jgi:RNA polymerase sigma factor (sigma-70 family)